MIGIGFFAPLPLAMMIPFMSAQSMMMGLAFGESYQYGKRKISAMSNEEFNAFTPEMLGKTLVTDYNAIIPNVTQTMAQSKDFQIEIFKMMGEIILLIPETIAQFFGFGGQTTTIPPVEPPPVIVPPPPALTGLIPPLPEVVTGFWNWLLGGAQQLYDDMVQGKFTGEQEQTTIEDYLSEVAKIFHDKNEYVAGLKEELKKKQDEQNFPIIEPPPDPTADELAIAQFDKEFAGHAQTYLNFLTTLHARRGRGDMLASSQWYDGWIVDWNKTKDLSLAIKQWLSAKRNEPAIKARANAEYLAWNTTMPFDIHGVLQ